MAYGGIIRSPYPHAKVLSIDFSEVKKMPGVLGTLTPDDVPQVHFNVTGSLKNPSLIEDQSILTWHPLHEATASALSLPRIRKLCTARSRPSRSNTRSCPPA